MPDTQSNPDTLHASDFLNRLDSGLIYGILGVVAGGLASSVGFLPASIGSIGGVGVSTPVFLGAVLFIAEVVNGAVNK